MNKLVIASMERSAGKTSMVIGIAKALGKKMGYMKPFGDRLVYRKKRAWDYDAALLTNIFGLQDNPEDMTIGFEHSKLRYMYDESKRKEKLVEMAKHAGGDKDITFIEGGRDLSYGASVHLDALSVARYTDTKLVFVISGNDDAIVDHISFLKKYVDAKGANLAGVIINKVHDIKSFKDGYLSEIKQRGINVLGVVPQHEELIHLSAGYLAERMFAKVITGESALNNEIRNIVIGAMSVNATHHPSFKKEKNLVITSGDRSDMILTAIETGASCIMLTNSILPTSNIISAAREKNVPMLLVPQDTYHTASQIDDIEPLMTKDDKDKINTVEKLVKENVELKALL